MPVTLLTNEELDTLLVNFLATYSTLEYSADFALFKTLYDYGFRVRELKNLETWTVNEFDEIVCPTSKNGNNRFLELAEVHPRIVSSIVQEENFVFISSYDYYKNAFKRRLGIRDLTINEKSLSTHAFRHNRIKQLSEADWSVSEIKAWMGIVDDQTVNTYINSPIYAHT